MNNDIKLIQVMVDVLTKEARNITHFGNELTTLNDVADVINDNGMLGKRTSAAAIRQAKYRLKKQGVLEELAPDFEVFQKK